MKVGHGIKLNKIILVGILIAALVISSGCAEDSTSADNSEVPAPAEAMKELNQQSLHSRMVSVGKSQYPGMPRGLFARDPAVCATLYTSRLRIM